MDIRTQWVYESFGDHPLITAINAGPFWQVNNKLCWRSTILSEALGLRKLISLAYGDF